jgi:hypothetical protein
MFIPTLPEPQRVIKLNGPAPVAYTVILRFNAELQPGSDHVCRRYSGTGKTMGISVARSGYWDGVLGGLQVSADAQVLDEAGDLA